MLSTVRHWWHQFPPPLRELASVRLVASFGAGGVLYLTPMVFHQADFSASEVGIGLALAALAGTIGRFLSGWLLDRGQSCGLPVLLAALCGFSGDALLFGSHNNTSYIAGQLLMGTAGGLYWPAVELAVPLCSPPVPSARGYALCRTADAAGIAAGTLVGALLAQLGRLRGIYLVDITAVLALTALLLWRPLPRSLPMGGSGAQSEPLGAWLPALMPMLLLSVVATSIPALMQSALPLDLVQGGLARDAQPEAISALLIGLPLALLVVIQWPVGQAMARRSVAIGLGLSMICFCAGSALLALSALSEDGLKQVALALVLMAFGEAAFLPTSTEAVVELSPKGHGGFAMALFSQCFAISAFGAPLIAGFLLDRQGHGLMLWSLMSLACGLCLLLVGPIRRRGHVKE